MQIQRTSQSQQSYSQPQQSEQQGTGYTAGVSTDLSKFDVEIRSSVPEMQLHQAPEFPISREENESVEELKETVPNQDFQRAPLIDEERSEYEKIDQLQNLTALLKQNVQAWNRWRKAHPHIRPYLAGVDFSGCDLRGANLSQAILKQALLRRANLNGADLQGSDLTDADLSGAILRGANLQDADLTGAILINASLIGTNLKGAKLRGADLRGTIFDSADLTGTNFDAVRMYRTVFGDVDLSVAKGLATVKHRGPSIIGLETIARSKGAIPAPFLKGAGVADAFNPIMQTIIRHLTCFISYAREDQHFVDNLQADLQSNDVRCWLDPEHIKREEIRSRIDDKLLVVLSKHSTASDWLHAEIDFALQREAQLKKRILFIIRLDGAETTTRELRRHIVDFTLWHDQNRYYKALSQLLSALKGE